MTHQSDALRGHILAECGDNVERLKTILLALEIAKQDDDGSASTIVQLEIMAMEFIASASPVIARRAAAALRRERGQMEQDAAAEPPGAARRRKNFA